MIWIAILILMATGYLIWQVYWLSEQLAAIIRILAAMAGQFRETQELVRGIAKDTNKLPMVPQRPFEHD